MHSGGRGAKRGRGGAGDPPPKKLCGKAQRQWRTFWAKAVRAKEKELQKADVHPAKLMLDTFGPGNECDNARNSLRTLINSYGVHAGLVPLGSATWPSADANKAHTHAMTLPLDAFALTRPHFTPPHEDLLDLPQLITWKNWFQDILSMSHGGWEKNVVSGHVVHHKPSILINLNILLLNRQTVKQPK